MKGNIILLTILFFFSCTKDPKEPTPIDVQVKPPTPYVFEIPSYFGNYTEPLDNPTTNEGVELGRHLFYENKLSGNNTMSCATCHKQELGFADGLAVSPGIDGIPGNRSTMALSNMQFQNSFFWDGRSLTLEHQALGPIQNPIELKETLENVVNKLKNDSKYPKLFEAAFGKKEITPDKIAKAISQFERTLISSNSKYDKFKRREIQLSPSEERGRLLFLTHPQANRIRGANCGDCHGTDLFRENVFLNNGLDEVLIDKGRSLVNGSSFDEGKFKVPSLRNIAVTAPYMHDGRFANLEQVLDHYNEHVNSNSPNISPLMNASNLEFPQGINPPGVLLTTAEKADLLAFLHTLTDSTFLTNPKFAKP